MHKYADAFVFLLYHTIFIFCFALLLQKQGGLRGHLLGKVVSCQSSMWRKEEEGREDKGILPAAVAFPANHILCGERERRRECWVLTVLGSEGYLASSYTRFLALMNPGEKITTYHI